MNAASPATHHAKEVQFNLQDINVHFGPHQALHNINLQIAKGDRLALIGANGSGKSTLLRVLHGLITATNQQVNRSNDRHLLKQRQARDKPCCFSARTCCACQC